MKSKQRITQWLALLALLTLIPQSSTAFAQGTAFTYQGQLQNNGSPASGTYNLTFSLFDTNTSGVPIAGPVTNNGVGVTNGLFTVLIDFGPGVFTGATNWLEIAVETNGVETFTTLAPRQQSTPTPYAIYAESASDLSGKLSASQLTSVGNDNGGFGNFFVGPAGNPTTSGWYNTANGNGALNFNTDGSYNTVSGYGALYNNTSGWCNTANGAAALGNNSEGSDNTASGFGALYNITDGSDNIALGYQAGYNFTGSESSNIDIGNLGVAGESAIIRIGTQGTQTNVFIAGIYGATASGGAAVFVNAAGQLGTVGTVPLAQLPAAVLTNNQSGVTLPGITLNGPLVLPATGVGPDLIYSGGTLLMDADNNANFFIGQGAGNVTMSGSLNTGEGLDALQHNLSGSCNTANGTFALSGNTSGNNNTANGFQALSGNTSGSDNTANGDSALRNNTSGSENTANGSLALYFNTSGSDNTANGYNALNDNTNGSDNTAEGFQALYFNTSGSNNIALGYFAGGFLTTGNYNIDIGNEGVGGDSAIIRIGTPGIQTQTFIAGVINGDGSGLNNLNASQLVSGTVPTSVLSGFQGPYYETIGGGQANTASGSWATVSGGDGNTASGGAATVGGGQQNTASGNCATVGGGYVNTASSPDATVGGGVNNQATNNYATVPGGYLNLAGGQYSFAAGFNAQATNIGAFVWSDGTGTLTTSTNANSVTMRASGGYRFFSGTANTTYAFLAAGSGSWTSMSDRNAKEHFQAINPLDVLNRVSALPVSTWNYKTQPTTIRHIGPTAQDFKATFAVGETDIGISTVDEGGVALAAIQGLNQKVEELKTELNRRDAENAKLKQQNDSLAERLNELEQKVQSIAKNQ